MPRRRPIDTGAIDSLNQHHEGVVCRRDLVELGMPSSTVSWRTGPGGPWQRPLPGVVVLHSGPLTWRQRVLCAIRYAGPNAVVTGPAALRLLGFRALDGWRGDTIDVLITHDRSRKSTGFVAVERTIVDPRPLLRDGLLVACASRAVLDTCRRTDRLNDVRELIAYAVQRKRVTIQMLLAEIRDGQNRRSLLPRRVMEEIRAGVRSVAEAKARSQLLDSDLPRPLWNVTLQIRDGRVLATVDAYWPDFGVVLELDSVEWHISPASYRATQRRQARLTRAGLRVIPFAPADLDTPGELVNAVKETLATSDGPAANIVITVTDAA